MNETSKNAPRRIRELIFDRYMQGRGIDIGCGNDPVTPTCERWDFPQGDAQYLEGLADESFDWVFSSHCLEHMVDPVTALHNWWRVLKPGGHLIVSVPDFALYEQFQWPSVYNSDHKHKFSIQPNPDTLSLVELFSRLHGSQILRVNLIDDNFDYSERLFDRTWGEGCAEIESIVRKQSNWTYSVTDAWD